MTLLNGNLHNAGAGYVGKEAGGQVIAAGSAACSVEKPMQAEDMTIPGALQRLIALLSFYGMDHLYE